MAQMNNYFTSMEKRYPNEDSFLIHLKPEDIQRAAKERIFRDMVRGKIDYSVHGKYFLDSKFLENLLITANDELNNNIVEFNALKYYDYCFPGQQSVINLMAKHGNLANLYTALYGRLMNVKMSGNIGYLTDIPYVLKDYKNIL